MLGGDRPEGRGEIAYLRVRPADAQTPAVLLQHVDARAPVRRVDHDVQGTAGTHNTVKRAQPHDRIRQMMENAGTDGVVEALAELLRIFDGKPAHLEVRSEEH